MATTAVYEGEVDVPEEAIHVIDKAVIASESINKREVGMLAAIELVVQNYHQGQNQKRFFLMGRATGRGRLEWTLNCQMGHISPSF